MSGKGNGPPWSISASVPWPSTGSSSSRTHGSPLAGSMSPLSTVGDDPGPVVALDVGSSAPSVMVSPSWSKVHLMKKDVAMIVTKVMTTALMVAGSTSHRRA